METASLNSLNSLISQAPHKDLDTSEYHGLAGDFVRLIDPSTESDPLAILVQFLAAFGNVVGKSPHFLVEEDKHSLKIYPVLVGRTAKGRKGTSWKRIRAIFEQVDKDWCSDAIVSGLSSGEGLINAVKDEKTQSPLGVRLFVLESEIATVLKHISRQGNILSAVRDLSRKLCPA